MPALIRAAFPNIIIPGRFGVQRPRGPFTINRDSLQAEFLTSWFPFDPEGGTVLRERMEGVDGNLISMSWSSNNITDREINPGFGLDFDGVADGVEVPSKVVNLNTGTFTMWIRMDVESGVASENRFFFDTDTARHAYFTEPTVMIDMFNDGREAFHANLSWAAGDLIHWAFRYDKDSDLQEIYKNGILSPSTGGQGVWGSNSLGTNLHIGKRIASIDTNFMDGKMFEVRTYSNLVHPAVIYQMWHPPTRWDLYYELGRVFYSFPAVTVGNPWHVYAQQ